MINPAGQPAIGGVTMLGLNFARTFDSMSWFGVKPETKKAGPAKPSHTLTYSSPSAPSLSLSKLQLQELLDACIVKHGAMDPFHSLFDQSLFFGESYQITTPAHGIPSYLDLHQSGRSIIMKAPLFTAFPPHISGNMDVTPFSALFPAHLLLESVEPVTKAKNTYLPDLATSTLHHTSLNLDQLLHDHVSSNNITSIDADHSGCENEHTPAQDNSGRTSPQSYAGSDNEAESPFGTLSSSRRSSWATSINTSCAVGDDDNYSHISEKPAAELDQNVDVIELLHDYEHYMELIDVGHPENGRKRDFIAPAPGAKEGMDVATAEVEAHVADQPASELGGDLVSECSEAPVLELATGHPAEPDMDMATGEMDAHVHAADEPAAEASGDLALECAKALAMVDEPAQADKPLQPEMSTSAQQGPRRTPVEEVALAHSHCDVNNVKLRVLSDDRGREYVLYRDCFHVLPIEMAREFMLRDNDDDDLDEPKQLGTIPEEEDDG
ncbi:hypothetical protein DHEL01_v205721 [Diaporthe helianthi]|uniref:Uncharacterized protein n=1 Tax=Diaporthe helianthi TaxID=158607 RepID=A0A2P5I093_DIAHE|nr:hypothetical protein DHEL01_v205721 [Diaporthe helianthi]